MQRPFPCSWLRSMGRWSVVALMLPLLAVASCNSGVSGSRTTSSTGASSTSAAASYGTSSATTGLGTASDWPTYHHDAGRSGVSSDQQSVGQVKQAWVSPQVDGDIYAEPLVVGGQVIVATEGNTVYSLDAASGAVSWKVNLGTPVPGSALPCGNIDPSGITGTPVADVSTSTLYVVGNLNSGLHHELFALSLQNGSIRWHRSIDPPGLSPTVEQQRGALALVDGRVYVPFGGLFGDCGQYRGAVVSSAADGTGTLASYVVPTQRMAGIWNPAGPVQDAQGNLLVTTGNSQSQSRFDYGNSVIRLSQALTVKDYFAPTNWQNLNATDGDLGSLGPLLLQDGRVVAIGKDGRAYLLAAGSLGGIGGQAGSVDIGESAFGAGAVSGQMVFVPCTGALVGLRVSGQKMQVAWKVSGGAGPPIVAAGLVWSLGNDGLLKAVDPQSGSIKFTKQFNTPPSRFTSLSASNGLLFVPDSRRITALSLR